MVATTTVKCAGESHLGQVRGNNEDRLYHDAARGIFIVVDGMGGEAAGEVAAETAIKVLRARLARETGSLAERVREAITLANNEIYRLAQGRDEWRGMACVLTLAMVADGQATIGHVGDTRAFKISGGHIEKITHDHSPVGEREDACELTEIEAMNHPRRNEVFRDVGSREHAPDDEDFIELLEIPFETESALLLCTDGLSDLVTSAEILQTIERNVGNRSRIVNQLIELANKAGGKDNVSVLFIEGEGFASAWRKRLGQPAVDEALVETHRDSEIEGDQREEVENESAGKESFRSFKVLWSRWAFLIYGIVLGVLLFYLWQTRLGLKIWPQSQAVSAPKNNSLPSTER